MVQYIVFKPLPYFAFRCCSRDTIEALFVLLFCAYESGLRRRQINRYPGLTWDSRLGAYRNIGTNAKRTQTEHRVIGGEERDGQSDEQEQGMVPVSGASLM